MSNHFHECKSTSSWNISSGYPTSAQCEQGGACQPPDHTGISTKQNQRGCWDMGPSPESQQQMELAQMNDQSHVEIPDAVMSAFTAAFGSVAKVRELEQKVKELEAERDGHKAMVESITNIKDTTLTQNDSLRQRISDLEVSLAEATKSKAEADSRIGLILDALRGVASEASAAVSLVEPPKPEPVSVSVDPTVAPSVVNPETNSDVSVSTPEATHVEDYSHVDPTVPSTVSVDGTDTSAPTQPVTPTPPMEADGTSPSPFAPSPQASPSVTAPSGLAALAVPQSADAYSHNDLAWLR